MFFIKVREFIKILLNLYYFFWGRFLYFFGVIDFIPPPNSNMRRTAGKTISRYIYSGQSTYLPIATAAKLNGFNFEKHKNILDFGCGVANQLRLFLKNLPGPNYYACDVDKTSINYIVDFYPQVNSFNNKFDPPLEFDESLFDLIYSVSTLSHFNEESLSRWITEFYRVLKRQGLLIVTIEGKTAIKFVASECNVSENVIYDSLTKQGFFYKNYTWLSEYKKNTPLMKSLDQASYFGDHYGQTVLDINYLIGIASKNNLEFLGLAEGVICDRQDILIFRKN